MSEYIIRVDENDERWEYVKQQYTHFFGYPITDEIVRCRDCKRISDDGLTTAWCSENCREVRPDDFCKWGERRG